MVICPTVDTLDQRSGVFREFECSVIWAYHAVGVESDNSADTLDERSGVFREFECSVIWAYYAVGVESDNSAPDIRCF